MDPLDGVGKLHEISFNVGFGWLFIGLGWHKWVLVDSGFSGFQLSLDIRVTYDM